MGKEDEQKSGREQPEGEAKCDKEQYERLKSCSDKLFSDNEFKKIINSKK